MQLKIFLLVFTLDDSWKYTFESMLVQHTILIRHAQICVFFLLFCAIFLAELQQVFLLCVRKKGIMEFRNGSIIIHSLFHQILLFCYFVIAMQLYIPLLLLLLEDEEDDPYKYYSTCRDCLLCDKRVPCKSLKVYVESAFCFLYQSGNDQALLNCMGFDHRSFCDLLGIFHPFYLSYTPDNNTGKVRRKKVTGWTRSLTIEGCLALVLMWYRTRGTCTRSLALIFGLTAMSMYKWLKFGRKVLLASLQYREEAKVCLPTEEEVNFFKWSTGKVPNFAGSLGSSWWFEASEPRAYLGSEAESII